MDKTGSYFATVAAFIPAGIAFGSNYLLKDKLLVQIVLCLIYLTVPLIFDKVIYNLRWEFKYGPEISRWQAKFKGASITFVGGLFFGTMLWMIVYMFDLDYLYIERYSFVYADKMIVQVIYYFLTFYFFIFIVPILEEVYFRAFVNTFGGQFGLVANLLGYTAVKVGQFWWIYADMYWMTIGLAIIFLVFAFILTHIFTA